MQTSNHDASLALYDHIKKQMIVAEEEVPVLHIDEQNWIELDEMPEHLEMTSGPLKFQYTFSAPVDPVNNDGIPPLTAAICEHRIQTVVSSEKSVYGSPIRLRTTL